MTIEQFGSQVCSALKKALGEEYETAFREVIKNNGVCLHSIVITERGSNISPAVYIDELYKEYGEGKSLGDIAYDILCIYKRHSKKISKGMDMGFFTQFGSVKDRILYKLIHKDSNRKLLKDIPYLEWNDLALVFYYLFEDVRFGSASILIRNSHLEMWKQNASVLYENAKVNMMKLKPEEMLPIKQVIKEVIMHRCGGNDSVLPEGLDAAVEADAMMYVLSNRDRMFGAAVLLYSKSLKALTDKLNKNLIILPSSVHEVLLVPDDGMTGKEFFQDMVKEVNDTQVEPEERLSYNVYYYDRISEKISIL